MGRLRQNICGIAKWGIVGGEKSRPGSPSSFAWLLTSEPDTAVAHVMYVSSSPGVQPLRPRCLVPAFRATTRRCHHRTDIAQNAPMFPCRLATNATFRAQLAVTHRIFILRESHHPSPCVRSCCSSVALLVRTGSQLPLLFLLHTSHPHLPGPLQSRTRMVQVEPDPDRGSGCLRGCRCRRSIGIAAAIIAAVVPSPPPQSPPDTHTQKQAVYIPFIIQYSYCLKSYDLCFLKIAI